MKRPPGGSAEQRGLLDTEATAGFGPLRNITAVEFAQAVHAQGIVYTYEPHRGPVPPSGYLTVTRWSAGQLGKVQEDDNFTLSPSAQFDLLEHLAELHGFALVRKTAPPGRIHHQKPKKKRIP